MSKKNQVFVYAYAILMIMVIDDHCGSRIGIISSVFPYNSFYMPMFVFISGYFFNHKNIIDDIIKKVKTQFLPYILIVVIGTFVSYVIDYIFKLNWLKDFTITNVVNTILIEPVICPVVTPAWFLLMLFYVSISYSIVRQVIKANYLSDSILMIVLLILNIASVYICIYSDTHIPTAVFLLRNFFYLFYFHLGNMFRHYYERYLLKVNSLYLSIALIVINLMIIVFLGDKVNFYSTSSMSDFNFVVLPLITSITGICFYYEVFTYLSLKLGENRIVSFIANNTRIILGSHLLYVNLPNFVIYECVNNGISISGFPIENFIDGPWVRYNNNSTLVGFFCGLVLSLLTAVFINKIKTQFILKTHLKQEKKI